MEKVIISCSVILILIMHYFLFKRRYKINEINEITKKQHLKEYYQNSIKNVDLSLVGNGIDIGEELDFTNAIKKIHIKNKKL